jgi:hypothetical protein
MLDLVDVYRQKDRELKDLFVLPHATKPSLDAGRAI